MDEPGSIVALLFTGLVLTAFVYEVWWKYRGVKVPPKYCEKCGCPVEHVWVPINTKYDKMTGEGTITKSKYWVCSNPEYEGFIKEGSSWGHYYKYAGVTKDFTITGECGKPKGYFRKIYDG